jgi:hypothetical protein
MKLGPGPFDAPKARPGEQGRPGVFDCLPAANPWVNRPRGVRRSGLGWGWAFAYALLISAGLWLGIIVIGGLILGIL